MPYTGGLGSYALVLLVTSILQHWERKAIHERRDLPCNLGTLLIEFFRFYGKVRQLLKQWLLVLFVILTSIGV